MFAVDHAATALLVKRRYPSVPLAPVRAVGLGIVSHLILDLATHGHDIVLWARRSIWPDARWSW